MRDRSNWPRCLPWHGWLPGLGLGGDLAPWADSLGQLAVRSLETVLGGHQDDCSGLRSPLDFWDAEDLAIEIGDHPRVFTDGSLDSHALEDVSVAGAGVYLPAPELTMQGAIWRDGRIWRREVG